MHVKIIYAEKYTFTYIYIIWVNPIINHPQYMEGYYGVYPYDWDDVSYDH
jgi:hypothetical protein